jgi:hypothetical protein
VKNINNADYIDMDDILCEKKKSLESSELPMNEKKKNFFWICRNYQPHEYSIHDNISVIEDLVQFFMTYRMNFKKKEDRFISFVQTYLRNYITPLLKTSPDIRLLYIRLLISIVLCDIREIRLIHTHFCLWLDHNLIKKGFTKDSYEHDSLEYQVSDLFHVLKICNLLKRNGYFYFDYLNYKSSCHSTILKSVSLLAKFRFEKRTHYEYLNSIYQEDRQKDAFGKIWDDSKLEDFFVKFRTSFKKIDDLYKKYLV